MRPERTGRGGADLFFLSDVHLAAVESEAARLRRTRLVAFLEWLPGRSGGLYILGDLFDFWFEWRHVVPRYWFPVLCALRRLVDSGTPVHFITGNHDFAPGPYLAHEVGLTCHDGACWFETAGRRFFVAHGDGYARRDRAYRLLKRVVRNRLSAALFRTLIPADLGLQLALWTSHASRHARDRDGQVWHQEYMAFARERFAEGIDFVLLGHLHAAGRWVEGGHVYVNCGDWLTGSPYARFDGVDLHLETWDPVRAGEP